MTTHNTTDKWQTQISGQLVATISFAMYNIIYRNATDFKSLACPESYTYISPTLIANTVADAPLPWVMETRERKIITRSYNSPSATTF